MTETLVIGLGTIIAAVLGSWLTSRAVADKARKDAAAIADKARTDAAAVVETARVNAETASDALYAQLCRDQQARIRELVGQIHANEERVTALEQQARTDRARISTLECDNDRLTKALAEAQSEIDKWKAEADNLRATLKSMQKRPAGVRP